MIVGSGRDHLWAQRLITVLVGTLIAIVGTKLGMADLHALGFIVAGWSIPHPADSNPRPPRIDP